MLGRRGAAMKIRSGMLTVTAAGLVLVLAATGAEANLLTLNFDNDKGTLNPVCTGSASSASCYVNPADAGSTWSDASGFQTSNLKAFGKGSVSELDATLKDRIKLTHDYDGNGKKDPTDANKITESFKTLTYSSDDMLSITNESSVTGRDGLFSYTADFEINPAGSSSPWVTVASFTGDGTDIIDLATFAGLDLTDGEKFATRIVTTADYDYSGINCVDGCVSVFRDRVTAEFIPEPPTMAVVAASFGLIALTFGQRRRKKATAS